MNRTNGVDGMDGIASIHGMDRPSRVDRSCESHSNEFMGTSM